MKAILLEEAWGLDNVRVKEVPDPRPGPGEVLIRIEAAALNFRDFLAVQGKYNPRYPIPLIPGSDGAGTVVEYGPFAGARPAFKAGDRVIPLTATRWMSGPPDRDTLKFTLGGPLPGTLAELLVVPETALVRAPDHLSFAEAAALQGAGLPAWSAFVTYGAQNGDMRGTGGDVAGTLRAGSTVVIQGTSAVSIFAMQLARLLGARALVTSGDDEKLARCVAEFGVAADDCINYRKQPDWELAVRERTNGGGADLILEIGGPGTLERSLKCVRPGGTIALIGAMGRGQFDASILLPAIMRNIRLQGIFLGHRAGLIAMCRAFEAAELRPVIHGSFAFAEGPRAIREQGEGERFGKLVVNVS